MSKIYPNCKAMTEADALAMEKINRANRYGISDEELSDLFDQHQEARRTGDVRTMEKIEYRLTDINFHSECGLLRAGRYDELRKTALLVLMTPEEFIRRYA